MGLSQKSIHWREENIWACTPKIFTISPPDLITSSPSPPTLLPSSLWVCLSRGRLPPSETYPPQQADCSRPTKLLGPGEAPNNTTHTQKRKVTSRCMLWLNGWGGREQNKHRLPVCLSIFICLFFSTATQSCWSSTPQPKEYLWVYLKSSLAGMKRTIREVII